MNKLFKYWLLAFFSIAAFNQEASAQITLSDFKVDGATSVTIYTNGAPAITHTFTVLAKRLRNSGYTANVDVYPVDGNGNLAIALPGSFANTPNWTFNNDGYDYCTISGNLRLDDGSTGFGTYKALKVSTAFNPIYRSTNTVQMVRSNNPPSTSVPYLNALSLNSGLVGTYVTIIGSGLGDATKVTFNGVATTIIAGSVSATNLSVYVPSGAITGYVVVTNPRGPSNGLLFTVNPTPTGSCSSSGTSICVSQNVPYTSWPVLLTGQVPQNNTTKGMVYRWEYSYSNNSNDWHTINGQELRNFQPWDCWQTVYYRRVILLETINIWGQVYHDFYANSNVATIIPYVTVTPGLYKIRNRKTGQVLEIGGVGSATITDGAAANQWPSVGTANQEWNITATSTGVYKIVNRNSSQALEIGGSDWNMVQPGSVAHQWTDWGGKNQQWLFQPVYGAPGYYTITNANSGQVLEIGGGAPVNTQPGAVANQWPYAGKDFYEQQWELVPVNVQTSTRFPGVYTIKNVNSQKLLEIGGASTDTGATANQWSNVGTANQQWTFVETSTGFFKIINRNSGLVLRIGLSSNVANQGSYTNSLNEQWDIYELTPGVFKITNRSSSSQALEIQAAYKFDGATADVWPYWGGTNQQWILTMTSQNRVASPLTDTLNQQLKAAQLLAMDTGHKFEAESKLSLYPNPASVMLNLRLSNKVKIALIKITDMRGAVILTMRYPSSNQVDISSLTAGVYLLTVSDGKRDYQQKFIKK